MTWRVRHQGSPQSIDGLTLDQVVEGLRDGQWEPTDEVVGPGETDWTAIEAHPQLAEVAADIEPPPPPHHEDETRLDMNPLIDVALVLLVFFILTATYETVRKVMDAPSISQDKDKTALPRLSKSDLPRLIRIKAYKEKGETVVEVEGQRVEMSDLERVIAALITPQRNKVLLYEQGLEWGSWAAIQDIANTAGAVEVLSPRKPPK
jgi:biopolymer transport protein ExbD